MTQSSNISHVPHMEEMLNLFKGRKEEKEDEGKCEEEDKEDKERIVTPADPAGCLDTFTQLLPFSHFTRNLWLGLVPSLGGIAIGTVRFPPSFLSILTFTSSLLYFSANKVGTPSLKS